MLYTGVRWIVVGGVCWIEDGWVQGARVHTRGRHHAHAHTHTQHTHCSSTPLTHTLSDTHRLLLPPIHCARVCVSSGFVCAAQVQGPRTRLWYVTTGYLARLCGHAPTAFASFSHLIIDECHERSVDADLLCLLCRRLLREYPQLKLILMYTASLSHTHPRHTHTQSTLTSPLLTTSSPLTPPTPSCRRRGESRSATAHNELLRNYFAVEVGTHQVSQPLHVGGRHFPIDTRYLDSESVTNLQSLPDRLKKTAKRLSDKCNGLSFTDLTIQGQPLHPHFSLSLCTQYHT